MTEFCILDPQMISGERGQRYHGTHKLQVDPQPCMQIHKSDDLFSDLHLEICTSLPQTPKSTSQRSNTSMNASISILMLAYNGGNDAIEAIKSLEHERGLIESIIISDNCSTDGSRELLKAHSQELNYECLLPNENHGFAGGFNLLFQKALESSKADYFLILNNDTEATPTFLQELLKQAAPNRIVSPMILWHRDKNTVIQCAGDFDREMIKMNNHFANRPKSEISPEPKEVEQTDGCCFLIHRTWLEQGFCFDPKLFIYFEDVDFFHRLRTKGVSFHYIPESVLYHKEYGSSGDRDTPSPFRNYYFYRNRMIICQRIHSGLKKIRVYWRLYRLAMAEKSRIIKSHPEAAKAIKRGLMDFMLGRLGKRYVPIRPKG